MADDDGTQVEVNRALAAAGRPDDEPKALEAIRGVAASHAGRPVDEVGAVLRAAFREQLGAPDLLSDEVLTGIAWRISESAPHA
ncbi:MAG: hypothetical protein JWP66_1234 [Naasia sp.]|nr:hypothetical protein [Naasia sp.]